MFNVAVELAITSIDSLGCFMLDAVLSFSRSFLPSYSDLHYTKDAEGRPCYIYKSVEALKNISGMLSQTTYLDIIKPTKDEYSNFLLRLAEQLKIVYAVKASAKRHCPRHSIAHHSDVEAFCQANDINYTTYSRSDPDRINLDLLQWLASIELEHILESIKHTVAGHLDNFS